MTRFDEFNAAPEDGLPFIPTEEDLADLRRQAVASFHPIGTDYHDTYVNILEVVEDCEDCAIPEESTIVDTLDALEPVPDIVAQISARLPLEVILKDAPRIAVGPFVLLDEEERNFLVQRIRDLEV